CRVANSPKSFVRAGFGGAITPQRTRRRPTRPPPCTTQKRTIMTFRSYLNCFLGRTNASPKAARPRQAKSRLGLEGLEDRLALSTFSTVNLVGRVLVFDAGDNVANNLTISRSGSDYALTDTAAGIQLGNSLNSTQHVDRSLFDRIQVNLKDQADTL